MEKGPTGQGYDQQKENLELRMRARKGMPEGIHKGQETGGRFWKAFSALPRRLDFVWRTTRRMEARQRHDLVFQKLIPVAVQEMYQNSSKWVDDGLIL